MKLHTHDHDFVIRDSKISKNEKRTIFVVVLTFITMVFEISYGYMTGSMALLADGWHMGSHVGALGISVLAYRFARSKGLNERLSFGAGKLIPLGGYTSALMLGVVAIIMGAESLNRVIHPTEINFSVAILVSVIGLIVNIVSALFLMDAHDHDHDHHDDHEHEHVHDHNHRSALIHVVADAFTSVLAIIALSSGKYFGWSWADPLMGIVGSLVILRWAYGLCKATVWELLDGNSKLIKNEDIKSYLNEEETHVIDLHIWRIAPSAHACELIIYTSTPKGTDYYREKLLSRFEIEHLIIEERTVVAE